MKVSSGCVALILACLVLFACTSPTVSRQGVRIARPVALTHWSSSSSSPSPGSACPPNVDVNSRKLRFKTRKRSTRSGRLLLHVGPFPSGDITQGLHRVWTVRDSQSTAPDKVLEFNPKNAKVLGAIPVEGYIVAAGDGAVWSAGGYGSCGGVLEKLDPATGKVKFASSLPMQPMVMVASGGQLWLDGESTLAKVDPATGAILATLHISDVSALAIGDRAVWAETGRQTVEVNPSNGSVVHRFRVGSEFALAVGPSGVWTSDNRGLVRIHPRSGKLTRIGLTQGWPFYVGTNRVWVMGPGPDFKLVDVSVSGMRVLRKIHAGNPNIALPPPASTLNRRTATVWIANYQRTIAIVRI